MSWIVETLLLNKYLIKEGIFGKEKYSTDAGDAETFFAEGDLFSDLIYLEQKVDEMIEKNMFTPYEIAILSFVMTGDTYTSLQERLGIDRGTISKKFRAVCERISFYVGGVYTDEGYIQYMKEKYNLRSYQVDTIRSYMQSRFRHTVRRTPHDR